MEIFMYTLRVTYILNIITVFLLTIKKVIMHKKMNDIGLYYSGWTFGTALFISLLFNTTFFMSDVIANSWHNLGIANLVLLIVMNILNLFITFAVFFITKKRIAVNASSFVIYNMFSKKYIEFSDIDTEKSEYIFVLRKSNNVLPKRNIFGYNEYINIYLKNGKDITINLNPFLFSGNKVLLFTVVVKQLKIKRKTL
ncbi:hypothetical protein N7603_02640 [Acholeplasma vituli]|uniref:DUF5673 domain-containing protein n=1 Tax=Paracholeplasma vituli TaxID=69473 RepID=A0ABT2PUC1_9MOLU|nr:hypothetical protein [Paracholeplasma vituli]MCU0104548.1 hypothetical protein [Paracholeplasma vituli]